jgi:hypothetical protein
MTRGWGLHCIDIFTGELVWKITNPMTRAVIADGYMIAANSWDGYHYSFGRGKTQTTVTSPDIAVPKGTAMIIKGTVLDMSPAQPGTPCVSEESMTTQMQYLHLQRPIDGLWGNETITGVPVTLTAIKEDGTYFDIGTTLTDGYSGKFGHAWTPTEEGTYKIIASFEGDQSYGSSSDTTFVNVGQTTSPSGTIEPEPAEPEPETPETPETPESPEQPETPETPEQPTTPEEPEPEPLTESPLITTEIAIILAIIVACIIGAASYWTLRKK